MGGKAAAAAIYPDRLCCAICKGLAAQIAEDAGSRITTLPMAATIISCLSLLCQEATGRSDLGAIEIEGEDVVAPTGGIGDSDPPELPRFQVLGLSTGSTQYMNWMDMDVTLMVRIEQGKTC